MASKHKIKRIERVTDGWTKASHKNAKIYFAGETQVRSGGSLKKKKVCKFNGGVHNFELIRKGELEWWKEIWYQYKCSFCGKLKHESHRNMHNEFDKFRG